MKKIESKKSIQDLHTFGTDVVAALYQPIHTEASLQEILPIKTPFLILGGGSNLLFTNRKFDGLIVHNQIKGIEIEDEDDTHVILKVGGGENWHDLVLYTIINDFGGIENLSLIPGTVGAAPIQNIGAYGVELKDVFHKLEAINLSTGKVESFDKKACQFGYRDSIFKQQLKGKYFITHVYLKLTLYDHQLQTTYGAIQEELDQNGQFPSVDSISKAVIAIRQSKLPDPKKVGNAGSFFKNPVLPKIQYDALKKDHPNIPCYPVSDTMVKVPAGWLIDQAGWKGYQKGDAGVHPKQALVLVNYGEAKGAEIWSLAQQVQKDIEAKYGILLEVEVNIIDL
jgi:UDP-N-acetylmuramate dehydrogenase